jgi:hypothetical protein
LVEGADVTPTTQTVAASEPAQRGGALSPWSEVRGRT